MPSSEENEAAVMRALRAVIEELNEDRDDDEQLGTAPDAILYGTGGNLDSLDLVRLVVLFEEEIANETDCAVSIADDRAISQENSHFHTVGSLVTHVAKLIEE